MKRLGTLSIFASLMLLTACPQTTTPPVTPQPPITPPTDLTVFPVSEISGTLPGWSGGEAYVTVASGYGSSSDAAGEN